MTFGGLAAGLVVALLAAAVTRTTMVREDASLAAFYLISLAGGVLLVSLRGQFRRLEAAPAAWTYLIPDAGAGARREDGAQLGAGAGDQVGGASFSARAIRGDPQREAGHGDDPQPGGG